MTSDLVILLHKAIILIIGCFPIRGWLIRLICFIYVMAGLACALELLAEPLYILSQNLLLLKLRLGVETFATLSRCLTTYIIIARQVNMVSAKIFFILFRFLSLSGFISSKEFKIIKLYWLILSSTIDL